MSLAKLSNTGALLAWPYTPPMLEQDANNTDFGVPLNDANILALFPGTDYAKQSGATVIQPAPTAMPAYIPAIQHPPVEATPIQVAGVWTQQWTAPVSFVPQSITKAQAKEALIALGFWAQVQTMLTTASLADQTAWNDWPTWSRTSANLIRLATAAGLTSANMDSVFTVGAQINL